VLADGRNRRVRYGARSKYFDIRLPCGSSIDLYFDVSQPVRKLECLQMRLATRSRAVMNIGLGNDDEGFPRPRLEYLPRRRLFVFGNGPAAVYLCRLAKVAGFQVNLYSSDSSTATFAEAAGAHVTTLTSAKQVHPIVGDDRTAIVFMFHDHEWEAEFLPAALSTEAFYVGALGSSRTHENRRRRLEALGFDPASIDRVRGPAGHFQGYTAPDIALSILAEIAAADLQAACHFINEEDELTYLERRAKETCCEDQSTAGRPAVRKLMAKQGAQ
jgi:xanthine dehydrogenase accessory factor